MLQESGALDHQSPAEKAIIMRLAQKFQSQTNYLFMSPEELEEATALGSKDQWNNLLKLQETKNFIKGSMASLSEIAQRKTFQSLVQSALEGNHQAAKQVQELSGILNQQDTNRTIVLHSIPRPKKENIQ